jgi:Family of unknown function (DUF5675)
VIDLHVYRKWETARSVCGELWRDGSFWLYTLEPSRYGPVNPGHPCIPAGKYQFVLTHSPHLGYVCPELVDVPGRSAIRIHIGNEPADVLGCTAIGYTHDTDWVGNSGVAFRDLMRALPIPVSGEITYHDGPPPQAELFERKEPDAGTGEGTVTG